MRGFHSLRIVISERERERDLTMLPLLYKTKILSILIYFLFYKVRLQQITKK